MKNSYKITLFLAAVTLISFLSWDYFGFYKENHEDTNPDREDIVLIDKNINDVEENFEGEVDPVWMVRGVLAEASKNNEGTVWERGSMSEPTFVSDILENEHAWMAAYNDLQSLLMIDTKEEMDILWAELQEQKMVGEWETVIAEQFYPNTL